MNMNTFHDLNIDSSCELNEELWNSLYEYNIRVVAISQTIDCTEVSRKRKKGEKQEEAVPEPKEVKIPDEFRGKLIVLRRLTVKFSDASQWYRITKSQNLKKYHVLAALPMSGDALSHCCSTGDADIITFEPNERPSWRMSKKFYKMALSKNVFFELNYGPTILDVSSRKNVIQTSQLYRTFGKAKNIIVSSYLTFPFNLRAPYDIMNLCGLFGLSMGEAKGAILNNPKVVLVRAASRLQGKAIFKVTKKSDQETESSSEGSDDDTNDVNVQDESMESMEIC